ncbi:hypothetical protein VHEMI03185 [[Torrubiella] hemipterigena]|uniref:NmrA-like domain-containing protein n=1 Tax=[Torrubiella] hemipterigena TaxID=1531966 RepID=A0A0A1TCT4_9HYPO|nr:hypothetical protein VHEMI03185 [[Torrubiella] hemipterigena]
MSAFKNVAIIGASGNIGKIILEALLRAQIYSVTVITRVDSDATFVTPNVYRSDFSEGDLVDAFRGQDVIISAVGAAAFDEQQKIIDCALAAGVRHFMPSEFSASSQDEAVNKLLPLFSKKADLITYLREQEPKGLSWSGIATSGLLDWGLLNGFLEFDIPNKRATVWDDGNKSFTMTNEKQLGDAVIAALKHWDQVSNRYIYVASVETTQNKIVEALEKATASKWDILHVKTETQVQEATKQLTNGDYSGALTLVRATVFSNIPGLKSNYAKDEVLSNDVLGLEMEEIEETVQRIL